jgi:hypothetical protein
MPLHVVPPANVLHCTVWSETFDWLGSEGVWLEAAVKVGPFKRSQLGRNNLNEPDIRSVVSAGYVMVLYAKQIGSGVSARAYNIEERAAYGNPCMPSYAKDIIILV